MTSLKKQQGFTIVELLIVIVVIGILAALVVNTFSGIQKKARDTERQTDIKAIHGQLEAYYAQNGYYPALAEVTVTNFKGLDADALKDPKGGTLAAASSADRYGYVATVSGGSGACTTAEKNCAEYTLTATLEAGGTFEKKQLN